MGAVFVCVWAVCVCVYRVPGAALSASTGSDQLPTPSGVRTCTLNLRNNKCMYRNHFTSLDIIIIIIGENINQPLAS